MFDRSDTLSTSARPIVWQTGKRFRQLWRGRETIRLIAIDFSPRSLPTSPWELSEREVTSLSNLKVVGALDNYPLVFVIFINFFGQLKDWVRQVHFLVSCPKGQVEKYVNVEACVILWIFPNLKYTLPVIIASSLPQDWLYLDLHISVYR